MIYDINASKKQAGKEVTAATLAPLTPFKGSVRTITSDNGKEFAYHEEIAARRGWNVIFILRTRTTLGSTG